MSESDKELAGLIAELEQQGVDPATAPEATVARLREMREQGKVAELAAVRMLAQIPLSAAAQLLAEVAAGAHGVVRREAKRALFKLEQRGVSRPTLPLTEKTTRSTSSGELSTSGADGAKVPAPARTTAYSALSALISPFDTMGTRLVWLLRDLPRGGVHRLWGVVSSTQGLVAVMSSRQTRRQLRDDRAAIEQESKVRLVDAEPKLADFILCEAYRRTAESDRGAVGNFLQLRAEIVAAPAPEHIDHPVYRELGAGLDVTPSPALLDEPAMAAFVPPKAELEPFAEEIEKLRQSPLVLSPAQQRERLALIAERALEHMLQGERKVLARRYLEDAAYYLAHAGRAQAAQWAAAAANMLAAGNDVRHAPLFQKWIQSGLNAAAADIAQREAASPRLILTPAEARSAAASRAARR